MTGGSFGGLAGASRRLRLAATSGSRRLRLAATSAAVLVAACSQRPAAESPPADGTDAGVVEIVRNPDFVRPDLTVVPREDAASAETTVDATGAIEEAAAACSHVPGVCCVAVQPLGDPPADEIDAVVTRLRDFYGFEVRLLDSVDLPDFAYYEPRQRWRAEKLLDFLRPLLPEGCDRIAGVTAKDISTTKGDIEDWGILGLADLPGTAAVLSSFRCKRKVHQVPPLERLARVAIHEVGHTLGLEHCPTFGCFLEDAGGKAETIDRETFLCDVCRERLGWVE